MRTADRLDTCSRGASDERAGCSYGSRDLVRPAHRLADSAVEARGVEASSRGTDVLRPARLHQRPVLRSARAQVVAEFGSCDYVVAQAGSCAG